MTPHPATAPGRITAVEVKALNRCAMSPVIEALVTMEKSTLDPYMRSSAEPAIVRRVRMHSVNAAVSLGPNVRPA